MRLLARVLAVAFAALAAGAAAAAPGLVIGVAEDAPKWDHAVAAGTFGRDLGIQAFRVTVTWKPREVRLGRDVRAQLDRAVTAVFPARVVVAVYGRAVDAPQTPLARNTYCAYVADLLRSYPTIRDVVVWNEPNAARFWRPQYSEERLAVAPVMYEALLARCWDVLHAARRDVNVIAASAARGNDFPEGPSNISHSPGIWYRQLGLAYRISRRARPIMDTIGHNPYPAANGERPWISHPTTGTIGQGDYDKLMRLFTEGFSGTGQPLPGQKGVSIWYMEQGFQTAVDPAKAAFYTGRETERFVLPALAAGIADTRTGRAPDQATQLADALRLAYCQPGVGAIFNFLLADEALLGGWQSGVLWADWTPKPSYDAYRRAIADVRAGRVACSQPADGAQP